MTPISLLGMVLLSTPKQAMGVGELHRQVRLCLELLRRFRYSDSVTIPDWSPEDIVRHGVSLGVIEITEHPLGDVVHMDQHDAVLMTYFRNNILHLFAIPASIACCFIQGRQLERVELQRLVRLIYAFMKRELCLQWDRDRTSTKSPATRSMRWSIWGYCRASVTANCWYDRSRDRPRPISC